MKKYDSLSPELRNWLLAQPVFFVASAPLTGRHVNVSPKGRPSFSLAVLSPNRVSYVDATGSGCETVAHVRENGRLTLMGCSFGPAPRILRLFSQAAVVERDEPGFDKLISQMKLEDGVVLGARAVLTLGVFAVTTSCGFGVPKLSLQDEKPYLADRDTLAHWAQNKIKDDLLPAYRAENNAASLDGLPGLKSAVKQKRGWYRTQVWWCRHRRALELVLVVLIGVALGVLLATSGQVGILTYLLTYLSMGR